MAILSELICFGAAVEYIIYELEMTMQIKIRRKIRRNLVKKQKEALLAIAEYWKIGNIMQIVEVWRAQMQLRPRPPPPKKELSHQENLAIIQQANRARGEFGMLFTRLYVRVGREHPICPYRERNRFIGGLPDLIELRIRIRKEYIYMPHCLSNCRYTYGQFFELPMGGEAGFSYLRHYGNCERCNQKLPIWRNCPICQSFAAKDVEGLTYARSLECISEQHNKQLSTWRFCPTHYAFPEAEDLDDEIPSL